MLMMEHNIENVKRMTELLIRKTKRDHEHATENNKETYHIREHLLTLYMLERFIKEVENG